MSKPIAEVPYRGASKGGLARAARMTAEQRSDSARHAVQARWIKTKPQNPRVAAETISPLDTSREGLHRCLERIKNAKDERELRQFARELQRIVFHNQYENAED